MRLTHPWREVQERFLIKLLELNTLNEHFSHVFISKNIFDKVLKLAEGVIKPLQGKKTLNILTKS